MSPLHILVIDDRLEDRRAVRMALTDAGFAVSEAANGAEGIEAVRRITPGCILLGCRLPDMEVLAVLEKLVPDPVTPEAAVVMLTSTDDDEAIANLALKKGAQDYLAKSRLDPHDLRRVVGNAIGRLELLRQRKQAEDALAANEARYRSIVEDQTEMVSRFRADGTLTFVNAAYARTFGHTPAELEGTSIYDLVPDVECAFVRNTIARLTPRNPVATHRHRALAADGTIRWQEWTNRLLPKRAGTVDEYQGTGRDITERKRAEDALRDSEARFRGAFENAAVGMGRVALDGTWLEVNDRLCEITGYSRKELLAKSFQDITHHGDLAADLDNVRKLLAGEVNHFTMDKRYIRKDGRIVWVGLTVALQRDASKVPQYFISVVRDINDQKLAEQALRESEAFNRSVLESSPDCVKVMDAEGRLQYMNTNCHGFLEIEDDRAIIGRPWQTLWPQEMCHIALQAIAAAREGRSSRFEAFRPTAKGTPKWWDVVVAPVVDAGETVRIVATSRDITAHKQTVAALRASEAQLAQAVAVARIGIFESSFAASAIDASPALRDMLGFDEKEPVGLEQVIGRIISEDRPYFAERVARARDPAGDGKSAGDYRIRLPSGGLRWLTARVQAFFEGEGAARHWVRSVGAVQDVTEHRQAEEELRQLAGRLRLALMAGQMGVWDWNLVSGEASWDATQFELCGYPPESPDVPMGGRFLELVHPEDRAMVGEIFERSKKTEEPYRAEFRIVRPDGVVRWLASQGEIFFDQSHKPVRMIGVNFDITERKEAEEALRESEERFRIITTTAQEGIWSLDRDGKILFVNPRMAELLGTHSEEMIGKPANEFCFPEDRAAMQEKIAANLAGERIEFEFRFRRRDSAPLHLLAATSPLHGSRGEVIGALGGFLNLAERKAAEDHQRFLMRELSHRSKNLLAIVQAMASQTARSATSLADFQERFSQRLQGIAASHDVLVSQNWAGAPLADLIRQHLGPFMEAGASRLRLEGPALSLKPEAAQALGLALHELATNSVKYGALSRPDGKVTVAWTFEEKGAAGRRLRLDWQERGGPRVAPPARKGFGHAVINRMVAQSLDGTVKLDFAPEGLSWSLSIPATHLANPG